MGDINPTEIFNLIQNRRPRQDDHGTSVIPALNYTDTAAPRWSPQVGATTMAGPSGPSQGLETEYTTAPSTSAWTGTNFQPSSVFSGDNAASEASWAPSTAPSHPRERLSFAQQFAVGAGLPPPPPPSLWCEFHDLGDCPDIFDADDEDGWIRHHRNHLGGDLPNRLLCWFCDDFVFECTKGRRANFESRMRHIAGHIRGDGDTLEQMRPDFFMVQHLYRLGHLSDQVYDSAMQYSELPSSYQLPQEEPAYDSRPSKYGTKSQVQVHDQAKEDRERKHRKDSNRRKKR